MISNRNKFKIVRKMPTRHQELLYQLSLGNSNYDYKSEILPCLIEYLSAHKQQSSFSFLIHHLQELDSTPFTIQRIAELLLETQSIYSNPKKYLSALEKCILVSRPLQSSSSSSDLMDTSY